MKLKASAQLPEEERDYQDLKRYIKARYSGAKIKESDVQPSRKVLYVTTKKFRIKANP